MTPQSFLSTVKLQYATPRAAVQAFDSAGAGVTLVNLSKPATTKPLADPTEQNSAFYAMQARRSGFTSAPASLTWSPMSEAIVLSLASETAVYRSRVEAAGKGAGKGAPLRPATPAPRKSVPQAPAPQATPPAEPVMPPQEAAAGPLPLVLLGIAGGLLLLWASKGKRK